MNDSHRTGGRHLRVCVLMSDSIFAQGLRAILTHASHFSCKVYGPSRQDQHGAVEGVWREVDLFLLRIDRADKNLQVADLRRRFPAAKIVGFFDLEDERLKDAFRLAGGQATLSTRIGQEDLYRYLRETWGGQAEQQAEGKGGVVDDASERLAKRYQLTPRELEILELLTRALSTKEIAKRLFISAQTVSVHRKHILRKLGVNNTAGAVRVALEHDLRREFF